MFGILKTTNLSSVGKCYPIEMCKNACTVMLLETLDKNTVVITVRSCTYFPKRFGHFRILPVTMQPFWPQLSRTSSAL